MKYIVSFLSLLVLFTWNISSAEEKICTMEWNPQCWINWVTYGNPCQAEWYKIAYQGECKWTNQYKDREFDWFACSQYFDWCNQCTNGACTKMACQEQKQPYCNHYSDIPQWILQKLENIKSRIMMLSSKSQKLIYNRLLDLEYTHPLKQRVIHVLIFDLEQMWISR